MKKLVDTRRSFVKKVGGVALGSILLPGIGCSNKIQQNTGVSSNFNLGTGPSLKKFGIQLYTLRDVIGDNPKETLRQLASFGFKQIEGYEGNQGIYWGMPHKEFKKYINDLGMEMVSSHCNIFENFEQKAAHAAEAGLEYLICPSIGPQKSVSEWKKVTDKFNACGEICRKNGIRFAYHNHAYSFVPFSGMIPQKFMMENTNPEIVDHQMDIYWVVTAGADPISYFKEFPGRFRLCHVKDRKKGVDADERSASCNLGTGMIDYPAILKSAAQHGMKYFILEQERYDESTPMDAARIGAIYLKNLKFAT
jgi:sugar phosphate isomerase/epimerase